MNGLVNWVLEKMRTEYPEQFAAATGMSVDAMRAALRNNDAAALQRLKQCAANVQQQQPQVWQDAASWMRENFPGPTASEKQTQNQQPK